MAGLTKCRCAYCNRTGLNFGLQLIDGEVICRRGRGCAKRPAHHERKIRIGKAIVPQFLLEGYWYRISELAELAGVSNQVTHTRLKRGWHVEDTVRAGRRLGRRTRIEHRKWIEAVRQKEREHERRKERV